MSSNAANEYLKAKILTATPEQLQLMLFDGAISFSERGKLALQKKDYEGSYNSLVRAQKILLEMNMGLKHDVAPDLCKNLSALYVYCYRKLVEANLKHDAEIVDEALSILRYQRETWTLLMQQLGKARASIVAKTIDLPAPDARMEQSISMSA
ncbi:MAG: flagellar export chaperone FliS [Tepidisphaeraceae bacterium]